MRYAVQVTRNGNLEWNKPSRAFLNIQEGIEQKNKRAIENAKQYSLEWEERASLCEKMGEQTDYIGDTVVKLTTSDCLTMAETWKIGLNMMPPQMESTSIVGNSRWANTGLTWISNHEHENGNIELIDNLVELQFDQTQFLSIAKRRELQLKVIGINLEHPHYTAYCGMCGCQEINVDEIRGETYCNDCGFVTSDIDNDPLGMGYSLLNHTDEDGFHLPVEVVEEDEPSNPFDLTRIYWGAQQPVEIHMERVKANRPVEHVPEETMRIQGEMMTITLTDPITGEEYQTEIPVIQKDGPSNIRIQNPDFVKWELGKLRETRKRKRPNKMFDPIAITHDGFGDAIYAQPWR